ncbi:hypothetical protein [Calothrix sp. PCC 7507]|uniref:hypothetical protein n=1 Tax=Calothrix sp. PCC 7507 TaxID=99598 RepID=UPI00029F335A|nr:hypothetical protein [Calothrix sp. PCC 7507]AFY36158.1 hypothetical protein Cal7507_5844 [Calothrix sp. PCC 7507]
MLQAASTHLFIPEPSEDLIASEPWSVDIYADGLMNELFADIDQILDANGNFASQTVNVKYVPLQTVKVPQIILPNTANQPTKGVPHLKNKPLSKVVVDTDNVKPVSKKRQHTKVVWGRLLIVGTTLCVAIAGVIYLVQSEVLNLFNFRLTQMTLQVPQPQLPTKVDVEAELVDYILGALAVIDKQEVRNNQRSANPRLAIGANPSPTALAYASNQRTGTLPPPLTANNIPAVPQRSSIVERIYIPVYQAPSPMRYTPPLQPLPSVGITASRPDVVNNALNTLPKPAKPAGYKIFASAVRPELKPVGVRTAPVAVGQSANLLPALPIVPFRAAPPKLPAAKAPTPTTTIQQHASLPGLSAAAPTHTLEGLLELGDKSAALFKSDGVTHRIDIGESIGASGWTLVDVSKGEAIVRRNGEVRSIFTGQKL